MHAESTRILSQTERNALRILQLPVLITILFIPIAVAFAISIIIHTGSTDSNNPVELLAYISAPILILLFFWLLSMFQNLERDIYTKVHKIKGPVTKTTMKNKYYWTYPYRLPFIYEDQWYSYCVIVRSQSFKIPKSDKTLYRFYRSLKTNDEVEIEFSPNSRHIWSIKKVHEQ